MDCLSLVIIPSALSYAASYRVVTREMVDVPTTAGRGAAVIVGRVSAMGGSRRAFSPRGEVTTGGRYDSPAFHLSAIKSETSAITVCLRSGEAMAGRASISQGLPTLRRIWSAAISAIGTRSGRILAGRLLAMAWSVCLAAIAISATTGPMAATFGSSAVRHRRSSGRIAICGHAPGSAAIAVTAAVSVAGRGRAAVGAGRVSEVAAANFAVGVATHGRPLAACLARGYSLSGCSRGGGITATASRQLLITCLIIAIFSTPSCSFVSASCGRPVTR